MNRRNFIKTAAGVLVPAWAATAGIPIVSGSRCLGCVSSGGGGGGQLAQGEPFVIDVSGMGVEARSSSTPYLMDDFSTISVGQPNTGPTARAAKYGTWVSDDYDLENSAATQLKGSTAVTLASGKSLHVQYGANGAWPWAADARIYFPSGMPFGVSCYLEWHFYYVMVTPGQVPRNWKLWRWVDATGLEDANNAQRSHTLVKHCENLQPNALYYDDGVSLSNDDLAIHMYDNQSGEYGWGQDWLISGNREAIAPAARHAKPGMWHCVQHLFRDSTSVGASDGAMKVYFNWHDITPGAGGLNGIVTRTAGASNPWAALNFPNYMGSDSVPECAATDGAHMYVGRVYYDQDWRLTHFGNASTWATSKKRVTQVQLARSTTHVEVDPDFGEIFVGEPVYAYFRNSDGSMLNAASGMLLGTRSA